MMSNLKYLKVDELYVAEKEEGKHILYRKKMLGELEQKRVHNLAKMNGAIQRLQWIRSYITEKLDSLGYKDKGAGI